MTFVQLQGAELSCFELLARRVQLLEMKFRDKVAWLLFGCSFEEDSHIYLGTGPTRGLLMIAPELEEFASGLKKMTVPGEKGLGVILAESVQKVARPSSPELLSVPIPFPETRW